MGNLGYSWSRLGVIVDKSENQMKSLLYGACTKALKPKLVLNLCCRCCTFVSTNITLDCCFLKFCVH